MLSTELEYLCKEQLECFLEGENAFVRIGIHLCKDGMLPTVLECLPLGWNACYRVGMLSTELEYLCTELECFLEGWNAFHIVVIPLYRVGMLSRAL
jgi:hypothetical protein